MSDESNMQSREEEARVYSRIRVILTFVNFLYSCLIFSVLGFAGFSIAMRTFVEGLWGAPAAVIAGYYLLFTLVVLVLDLPLSVYSSFVLEHRYHLSNQTLWQWAWEQLKRHVLSFALGLILVEGLFFLMRASSEWWWLYAWAGWVVFSVGLGQLFPVFIIPLFYKYQDIEDVALKERLIAFVESFKMKVKDVYGLNLSKTTKKANACFCGLGPTKRVILSDTLLEKFTHDEIEMVLVHEIGHCKKHHIVQHMVFSCLGSLIVFYGVFQVLDSLALSAGMRGYADVAVLPVLMLLVTVVSFLSMPISNAFTRHMENEADDFAMDHATNQAAFETTMNRLAELNLANKSPHPFVEFYLYSHPSIARRIERQARRVRNAE